MDIFYLQLICILFVDSQECVYLGSIVADKRVSLDRIIVHTWETGQGKKNSFLSTLSDKSATDSFLWVYIFHDEYIFFYQILIALVYLLKQVFR